MKNTIITLSFILGFWQDGISQGNLQFNRVINLKYTRDTLISGVGLIDTLKVPANKVWKIESAGLDKKGNLGFNDQLLLDNFILDVYENVSSTANGSFNSKSNFPIWLSTGTYILYDNRRSTNPKSFFGTSISIIEFNLIP